VLRARTREAAALLFACGIDPAKSVVFVQSHVTAHAQLTWLLNCVTPVGWLERMTQYKTKSAALESVSTGLLDYPVLQAADILLYDTDLVPVGEDQLQHVELTRDSAGRFNRLFGETFKLPQPLIRPSGARIMGLDDPTEKMSKSIHAVRPAHAIALTDPPDVIRRTIMRATTDSGRETRFEHASAGVRNLLVIYEALSGAPRAAIEARFEGKGYGALKREVADLVVATLAPIQDRFEPLVAESSYLDDLLREGAERARPIADATVRRAMETMGLG
jgi:tryptophanyl-tRNA synthetase